MSDSFEVPYSYLKEQFADIDETLADIKSLVHSGDFTLGEALQRFEAAFAELIGTSHAIGVGSGTDSLKLSLKALGVGHGDEVITAANTFIATVGAIAELGARPVFVDCDDTFCMDVSGVEGVITSKTKAILPVHLTGNVTDMPSLMTIAERYGLPVVEDACQAILGEFEGRKAGTWGAAAGYSLHPLKNLNVWGDGGVIVTNDDQVADKLRLLRNHGLKTRDEVVIMGGNSRLDTLQAVVGNRLLPDVHQITKRRIDNAHFYDAELSKIQGITVPLRPSNMVGVFHLYMVFAEQRDDLYEFCHAAGVECKIHYPIPLYLQEGLSQYGYDAGDFPNTDRHAATAITFPADQHKTRDQLRKVVDTIRAFYDAN